MSTHAHRGFTIIETMLVLAITGLMVAGIFVGVGTQIGVQRYRDAVETFKTTIQNQFLELSSVRNDRNNNWECGAQAQTSETGSTVRGQSDCILVGRLMTVQGGSIRTASVVGREVALPNSNADDITSLRDNYVLNVASNSIEEASMEWGTELAWPASGSGARNPQTPRGITILILRSPDSGLIYTFTSDTVAATPSPATLRSAIIAGNTPEGQGERTLCVSSNNITVTDDYGVRMSAFAAVPNAVETITSELLAQQGRTTRC